MSDSSDDTQEHSERRTVLGVWQPRSVEMKHRIDPFQPAPKGRLVQCFVVKDSISRAFCLFLQLTPQLSPITNKGKFLLAAREISHVSRTEFSIWNNLDDLSEDSEFLVGKVLSNLSRTEYVLYDYRQCGTRESSIGCWRPLHGARRGSTRVLEVNYNMALGKPHQFNSVIHTITFPNATEDGDVGPIRVRNFSQDSGKIFAEESDLVQIGNLNSKPCPSKLGGDKAEASEGTHDGLEKSASFAGQNQPKLEDTLRLVKSESAIYVQPSSGLKHGSQKGSKEDLTKLDRHESLILKTKAYDWDEDMKRYYAAFNGRENVQGSSKNFQMVINNECEKGNEETLVQFGELSSEIYFMDYAYPLSAFEAFGICMTRLD